MINYFARFRSPAHVTGGQRQTSDGSPIEISSDATVSLSENGAVFLNARSGILFTSNQIGARIWEGIRERESVETIAMRISRESGVQKDQVEKDTAEFVAELETHGFLSRRAGC